MKFVGLALEAINVFVDEIMSLIYNQSAPLLVMMINNFEAAIRDPRAYLVDKPDNKVQN